MLQTRNSKEDDWKSDDDWDFGRVRRDIRNVDESEQEIHVPVTASNDKEKDGSFVTVGEAKEGLGTDENIS